MNEIEEEAKMISATIKWWNDEVSAVVERLEILHNQDIRNDEEIKKAENKLGYLYKKGSSEVKNIDRFFKKWDLD